jgi:multidrug resistance efflux pump
VVPLASGAGSPRLAARHTRTTDAERAAAANVATGDRANRFNARVECASARAAVASARAALDEATLRAPASGIVASVNGHVGEMSGGAGTSANGGSSAFITLLEDSSYELEASFDQVDAAKLQVGQSATVRIHGLDNERVAAHVVSVA